MKQFEIYFSDLTQQTQKRLIDFYDIDSEEEGNFECAPIAVIDYEPEEKQTI